MLEACYPMVNLMAATAAIMVATNVSMSTSPPLRAAVDPTVTAVVGDLVEGELPLPITATSPVKKSLFPKARHYLVGVMLQGSISGDVNLSLVMGVVLVVVDL